MQDYITIALPKGRLAEETLSLLERLDIVEKGCIDFNSRRLIFEDSKNKIKFILIRNMDVTTYVEYGACDLGVVGKDIILETKADIYELLDFGFGYCRMCVAAPNDFEGDYFHDMRVATKFVNIAKNYFQSKGIFIEVIKLYGSIEIAPLLSLSDFIVDLVSTGETLKKNGLKEIETIMHSTARLIANKSLLKYKHSRLKSIIKILEENL
ncbi:MAG: phosphoribosyltransferase [Deferribacteraceae bacterium]|jgi:ATP phosphoribosyltransferase|nr:phosphoribosyltransferase [Deferribacteraceae bacterium]